MDFSKEPTTFWELTWGIFLIFLAIGLAIGLAFLVFAGIYGFFINLPEIIQACRAKYDEAKEKKNR